MATTRMTANEIVARAIARREGLLAHEAADFAEWHWQEFEDHATDVLVNLDAAGFLKEVEP